MKKISNNNLNNSSSQEYTLKRNLNSDITTESNNNKENFDQFYQKGKKKSKLLGIPKLEDANLAGTK